MDLDADERIRPLGETAWFAFERKLESLSDLITDSEKLAKDIVEQFLPEPA